KWRPIIETTVVAPRHAAAMVAGSRTSPRTTSTPRAANARAAVSPRTSTRTAWPARDSEAATSRPGLLVAPARRIIDQFIHESRPGRPSERASPVVARDAPQRHIGG